MDQIPTEIFGALVIALPLIVVAFALFWRQQKQVFFFALAALIVGLGYLMATGATTDVAKWVWPSVYGEELPPTEIGDGVDTPADTPADSGAGAQ